MPKSKVAEVTETREGGAHKKRRTYRRRHHKHKKGGAEEASSLTTSGLRTRAMELMHQYKQAGAEHPLAKGWVQARKEQARQGGCGPTDVAHKRCGRSPTRVAGRKIQEDEDYMPPIPVKVAGRGYFSNDEDVDSDADEEVETRVAGGGPGSGRKKGSKNKKKKATKKRGGKKKKCSHCPPKHHKVCARGKSRAGGVETEIEVSEDEEDAELREGGKRGGRRRRRRSPHRRARSHSRRHSRSRSRSRHGGAAGAGATGSVLEEVRERAKVLREKAARNGGSLTWNESLTLAGAERRARAASLAH